MELAQAITDYLLWMISKGYAEFTIRSYGYALEHFQKFIVTNEVPWEEIFTFSVLTRFQETRKSLIWPNAVRGLARYLYGRQLIPAPIRKPQPSLPIYYENFLVYFQHTRGVGASYVMEARGVLSALNEYLEKRAIDLPDIGIEDVDGFSAQCKSHLSLTTRRRSRSHLRNFFRYLYYERRIIKKNIASFIIFKFLPIPCFWNLNA